MGRNAAGSSRNSGRKNHRQMDRRATYIHGSAAYNLDIQRQLQEEPKRGISHEARKNREKARHMSLPYVIFLAAALCMSGIVLVNYVNLQFTLTNAAEQIASKESELNRKRLENDEEYNRIVNSIDLEEIKRIAIGELGMTYAKEGQIETYTNEGNDYMRRVDGD